MMLGVKKSMKKILFSTLCLFLCTACSLTTQSTPMNPEKVILCLWDSLTEGYNVKPEDSYPTQLKTLLDSAGYTYEVLNVWHNGDTSSELVAKLDDILTNMEKLPSVALLTIGGNDGLRKMSTEDLEKNIETIIKKLKEKNIRVVLWGMQLEGLVFGFSYSGDFNRVYPNIAKALDVYLLKNFLGWVFWHSELMQSDLVHPNKDGYKVISQNIFTFLEENELIVK